MFNPAHRALSIGIRESLPLHRAFFRKISTTIFFGKSFFSKIPISFPLDILKNNFANQ